MKQILKSIFPEASRRVARVLTSDIGNVRYGFPSKKLKLIGVTGTSGKSTTSNLLYHVLSNCGVSTGVISTNGVKAANKNIDTGLHVTTPDPMDLQKLLRFIVDRGCEYAIIESSSHALAQGRLGRLKFDYAVYTNIKRDHLDWHGSWEHYANSKLLLAKSLKSQGKVVLNRDDKDLYNVMQKNLGTQFIDTQTVTYSMRELTDIEETVIGTRFIYQEQTYTLPIIGSYNVENALAVINVAKQMGIKSEDIAKAMSSFMGLEGRMQVMQTMPFSVIVDFAHNTDSLVRSLETARKLTSYKGKVINIFGSAGLRDVEKRFTMGKASAEFADVTIVTAEDPRTESLYEINNQILEGTKDGGGIFIKRFTDHSDYMKFVENEMKDPDFEVNAKSVFMFDEESVQGRYDAIDFGVRIAKEGDVVIAEGKGHEKSLCFGNTEYDFTDQEAVEKAINNLKS